MACSDHPLIYRARAHEFVMVMKSYVGIVLFWAHQGFFFNFIFHLASPSIMKTRQHKNRIDHD